MAWDVVYYTAPDESVPAIAFLDGCPTKVAANLFAVLDAVAEAPPPQYSGGGKWEAMHGTMGGYYEVRASGPGREQFRLFCLLENAGSPELSRRGLARPPNAGCLVEFADVVSPIGEHHRSADVALACLAYECLAGEPPFRRETEAEVLWAHMQEEPPSLRDYRALDPVLRKALAKQKQERYASCGEFVADARAGLGLEAGTHTRGAAGPGGSRFSVSRYTPTWKIVRLASMPGAGA